MFTRIGAALLLVTLVTACSSEPPVAPETQIDGIAGVAEQAERWFAASDAAAGGNGSAEHPWRLDTALAGGRKLNGRRPVGPGDTVFIRGGRYVGRFNTTVGGATGDTIVFLEWPGEEAILDGNNGAGASPSVLAVQLPYVKFVGLEITFSRTDRTEPRPPLVATYASHSTFVDLVLHDGGVAFYMEKVAHDVTVTGCLIYNNGWQSDRGHGHGLYLRSDAGPVTATGNVVFNQFGYGIHAFADAANGLITSLRIRDNVVFNNGTVLTGASLPRSYPNLLLGGAAAANAATDGVVSGNLFFLAPALPGTNVRIGYEDTPNGSVQVTDNVIAGGGEVLQFRRWASALVQGNVLVADTARQGRMVSLAVNPLEQFQWSGNRYYRISPDSSSWRYDDVSRTLAGWHAATGFTADSTAEGNVAERVVVTPRASGAFVTVFRPAGATIDVTLPEGTLMPGDSFVVRNVQKLSASPAAVGRYQGGAISILLGAMTPERPLGWSTSGPGTERALQVFVLEKR